VLLSALDQTVVSTAMPRIIEQLQGLSMYAWVTTAYMLTSTVSVPIYGKLSDQYGRKGILILGVVTFLAGSVLCGLAGEFGELPLVGGGMMQLIVCPRDPGPRRRRADDRVVRDHGGPVSAARTRSLFGVFGSVFGIATVVGPFIGGFLTDHGPFGSSVTKSPAGAGCSTSTCRWAARAVHDHVSHAGAATWRGRAHRLSRRCARRADGVDAAARLTLGGTSYPWDSPYIIALFATAACSLAVFLWVETRAINPILPLHSVSHPCISHDGARVVRDEHGFPRRRDVHAAVHAGRAGNQRDAERLRAAAADGRIDRQQHHLRRLVTRTGRYKAFMIGGGVGVDCRRGCADRHRAGHDERRPHVAPHSHGRGPRPRADAVQSGDSELGAAS
jgi:hypothetical protein